MRLTYWQLLKNSIRVFTEVPKEGSNWLRDFLEEIKTLIGSMVGVITMLLILIIWIAIMLSFPVSLPLMSGFVYFRQGTGKGKLDLRG